VLYFPFSETTPSTGAIAQLMPQALETLGQRHPAIDVQVAVLTSQETL